MKNIINKILNTTLVLTALCGIALFSSCEHKPLYLLDNKPQNVRVDFNWDNLRPNDEIPEGMRLYFTDESHKTDFYDVPTSTGLVTEMLPGEYEILGCTNDLVDVTTEKEGDDVVIKQNEDNKQAPTIYGVTKVVRVDGVASDDEGDLTQVITLKPQAINCLYNIRVINTDVVKDVEEWKATLAGLTNAILLGTGKSAPGADEITVPFWINNASKQNERSTTISVLGKHPDKDNIIILYLKLKNGTTVRYKGDVTSQIVNAKDFRNVDIVVDMNKLEKLSDGEGEGSLNPAVDPFPEESIEQEL